MSKAVKGTPARRRPARQSCIFREPFTREQVDPRVKELWEKTTGQKAPFGRLRMNFQREHCARINPYAGECPYRVEECGMAFLSAVQNSLLPWVSDPAAYFVKVARSGGIERADNKPLARERHREEGSGHARDAGVRPRTGRPGDLAALGGVHPPRGDLPEVLDEEDHLHRARRRPEPIGSLLGAYDFGSRPRGDGRGEAEGEE